VPKPLDLVSIPPGAAMADYAAKDTQQHCPVLE